MPRTGELIFGWSSILATRTVQFGSMELYTQWSYIGWSYIGWSYIGWSYIRWSSILAIELYSSSRWSYILAIELMVILLYV